jgi:hypothetical protein
VWATSLILFIFEIFLSVSYDDEDNFANLAIIVLMYFSYCQLWIYVVIKSAYQDYVKKGKYKWEKTIRFDTVAAQTKEK